MKDKKIMIIDDKLYYIDKDIEFIDWYKSIKNDDNFENIVRGYVINNKIILFKGYNFSYDKEVIEVAKKFGLLIRKKINQDLDIYVGILPGVPGEKIEGIVKIGEDELKGKREVKVIKKNINYDTKPLLVLKNDINNDFILYKLIKMTIITIFINFIIKIILFSTNIININSSSEYFIIWLQFIFLGITAYLYIKRNKYAFILGVVAGIFIIFSFHLLDIILGIIYIIYNIDINIISKMFDIVYMIKNKLIKR